MFKLGDKVSSNSLQRTPDGFGGIKSKGTIVGSAFVNFMAEGEIYYTVRNSAGQTYNYVESQLKLTKVQNLYAYTDSTDEVHWSTRTYSPKELKDFGFTEAPEYNKTIELE